MRGKPVGIATCGGGGLPCGLVLPACEVAQPEGVAVGRDSVLIPDAHLLRATNSVCCHSGVPTPRTKDLIVSQSLRLMPLLQLKVAGMAGGHSQRADRS